MQTGDIALNKIVNKQNSEMGDYSLEQRAMFSGMHAPLGLVSPELCKSAFYLGNPEENMRTRLMTVDSWQYRRNR